MGDTGEEWEIEEEGSLYTEETKSNARWILDKGLNIGKKIVITGVVISSAPFVLPPLIIISALGFAFSVPSGILLSSYACTEKLMSKFLPIGDEYWEKGFGNEDRYIEEEKGVGSAMGSYFEEEDLGKYLDIGGIEEEPLTKRANVKQPSEHDSITEKEVPIENKGAEERVSDEKIPTLKTTKGDIQEMEGEKKPDVDPRDLLREEAQDTPAERKGETAAGNSDEKDVGVTVVSEKTIVNGNEPSKKEVRKKKGNKKEDAGAGHEEIPKKKEEEKVVHSTDAAAKDVSNQTPEDTAELSRSAEVPESKQAAAVPTGKEVRVGEEKIWEKIDALRAIVGFKASPHKTYIEELRALYMFTGVEPPASFKDSSDLVEVNKKLGFLMSIVGVK